MKEVIAYQSDDGTYTGTKEEVEQWEKGVKAHRLYCKLCDKSDSYYSGNFNIESYDDLVGLISLKEFKELYELIG